MNDLKGNQINKKLNLKKFFTYLFRAIIFLLPIIIISNLIKGINILAITDLLAIIISSLIMSTLKLLSDKFCI